MGPHVSREQFIL